LGVIAQRATQAAGAATQPQVAQVATPGTVSGVTRPHPAPRPVDAIALALAAAIAEIAARRAASDVGG
jgi:hypothetical protein